MSVSASTLSSMATVEMEVFSQSQLWVLILLILLGGEVFTSMLGLQFIKSKIEKEDELILVGPQSCNSGNQVEEPGIVKIGNNLENGSIPESIDEKYRRHKSVEYLGYIVLAYLILVIGTGSTFVYLYLTLVPGAKDVVSGKGIQISTFSIFLTVSSFGNCGFTPANENMMAFKSNSALLLLTIFQILAGNTLYPPCLRLVIWVLKKLKFKGDAFDYILQTPGEVLGYNHLLPHKKSTHLALTVSGFVLVQLILFCSLEWNSDGLQGMNSYQKFVGALFLSVNSRHAGESILDLSTLSSAVLLLYMVMMYLPPYTTFLPIKDDESTILAHEKKGAKKKNLLKVLSLSNPSYLVIFVVLICITERRALAADPLNFNVLNIVFEVISAYGNVGFSIGYSCERLLNPDNLCKNAWFGFAGRWSNKGKFILILVMLFGRLKKFNMEGGKAWKLS